MKTALILAAGRGERLKPLTDTQPKALCTVRGIPLIEYHINHLATAGFKTIVINHAYLGGEIRNRLKNGSRWNINIIYSPEPPGGLETGGGIANALQYLNNEPFVTVNADILTDYDFSKLSLLKHYLAHVVLVNQPSYYAHADFGISEESLLSNQNKQFTFSGIACYSPDLLANIRPGRFSITPIIRQAADAQRVSCELHLGQWSDIGSPDRLALANSNMSRKPIA